MIKRLFSILICVIIALTAVGCGGTSEPEDANADPDNQLEQPVNSEAGWRRTIIYYASDEGFIAVSYTHLDVYKRQRHIRCPVPFLPCGIIGFDFVLFGICLLYTS